MISFKDYLLCEAGEYHGIFLDKKSTIKLLSTFRHLFPSEEGWVEYGDHMTISLGELPTQLLHRQGEMVQLRAVSFADDQQVKAVGVELVDNDHDIKSKNDWPHITLAVNEPAGGKPFLSNKLTNWTPIKPFDIWGKIDQSMSSINK